MITGVAYSGLYSGIFSADDILESDWEYLEKETYETGITYHVKGFTHCPFGPAVIGKSGESRWFIKGTELSQAQIKKLKKILQDVHLAPLYIHDPVLKYTAQYVLKNGEIKEVPN